MLNAAACRKGRTPRVYCLKILVLKFDSFQNSFQQVVVCSSSLFSQACLHMSIHTHAHANTPILNAHTLTHMHMQIRKLVFFTEIDEHLQKGVDILTSYINELRTFMIKFPWKPADATEEYDVNKDVLTVKEGKIWEKLSFEVNMSTHHISLPGSDSLRKHQKQQI